MRFSLRDLLLLTFLCAATVPVVVTATLIGMELLPSFLGNASEFRRWCLNHGFPAWFANARYLTIYVGQVPTIIVLSLLSAVLFIHKTRPADLTAVCILISLPVVDTFGVGMIFLRTQAMTALTVGMFATAYMIARRRIPNPTPSTRRSMVTYITLLAIFICSTVVWNNQA